ncbi:hypothetical protein [Pseudalkalibacillus hwajinpoensis]|uniref:Uncharacterized protein n=1 Tax=Guptibacillus hwajinpoensis TaxID=208199 RepID=A0A4U1MLI5_9BACL|nr:hypothetical protein [Pseudalkalibacillus hwajinpoensis]TKD72073.1 hypothetical protein FBF83_04545 [Pseudalkalibacillus hwajinpoensis]
MKKQLYFSISFIILFFFLQFISGLSSTLFFNKESYSRVGDYTTAENSVLTTIIVIAISASLAYFIQRWMMKRISK